MRLNCNVAAPSGAAAAAAVVLVSMILLTAGSAQARGEPEGVLGCCLPDRTCLDLDIIDCISSGGIRQPRPCAGSFCGACCTANGCIDAVVEEVCTLDIGGQYGGDQSDCSGFCLPGACCLPGGACEIRMSELDCAGDGGVFRGVDTTCEGVICRGCGVLGSIGTPRATLDLAFAGTFVYAAVGNDGLFVIDVSDPTDPSIVGFVDPGTATGVAVSGSFAYVADSAFDGLHAIDISDPTNPAVVGSVVTTGDFDRRVAVSGAMAYVTDSSFLHVIDVSDPQNPAPLGSLGFDFLSSVAVSGTLVFVGDNTGLRILDVSDLKKPALRGSAATGAPTHDIVISGSTAYVAGETGLHVIDVSDPAQPAILGFVPSLGAAKGVAVSGTLAYVAHDEAGVHVVDVSDPAHPVVLTSIALSTPAADIAVSGAVAYVAEATGVSVINASSCGNGVCCLTNGCLVTNPVACAAVLGTYLGDGTTCATATCPPGCATDVSGDGIVGFADVLRILTEWGPCPENP